MRLSRFVLLCVGVGVVAACSEDKISSPTIPALGGVRFINAVTDTSAVDIRMVDQVEFSAVANGLAFRAGTEHQPTEAKARHIRVFPTSTNITVTQGVLVDTTISIQANTRQTLLLTGSARAKTLKFVVISDATTAPAAGQYGVRVVNAGTGAIDAYLVDSVTRAITGVAPAAANLAVLAPSAYATKSVANAAAIRATDAGVNTTVNASAAAPIASVIAGALPAAGVNSEKTVFSVYYFPRGVLGSPQNAVATPTVVWFVDRNPADQ